MLLDGRFELLALLPSGHGALFLSRDLRSGHDVLVRFPASLPPGIAGQPGVVATSSGPGIPALITDDTPAWRDWQPVAEAASPGEFTRIFAAAPGSEPPAPAVAAVTEVVPLHEPAAQVALEPEARPLPADFTRVFSVPAVPPGGVQKPNPVRDSRAQVLPVPSAGTPSPKAVPEDFTQVFSVPVVPPGMPSTPAQDDDSFDKLFSPPEAIPTPAVPPSPTPAKPAPPDSFSQLLGPPAAQRALEPEGASGDFDSMFASPRPANPITTGEFTSFFQQPMAANPHALPATPLPDHEAPAGKPFSEPGEFTRFFVGAGAPGGSAAPAGDATGIFAASAPAEASVHSAPSPSGEYTQFLRSSAAPPVAPPVPKINPAPTPVPPRAGLPSWLIVLLTAAAVSVLILVVVKLAG